MSEYKENNTVESMPTLEVLLASIYYLMTRHARLPDAKISKAIIDHLEMLAAHPDCESDILIKSGRRLALQWREYMQGEQCVPDICEVDSSLSGSVKLH